MTTFSDRFSSYYLSSTPVYFKAWDLQCSAVPQTEIPNRRVNIENSAREHQVSNEVKGVLDRLITSEMHGMMARGDTNRRFYETRGFTVLKAGSTLVLEHQELPGYLIKASAGRRQFNYGTFPQSMRRVSVAHTNLLRPAGRDYYASQENDPLFSFPEEYLYETPHGRGMNRFYAISQKVDVYSEEESLNLVRNQNRENQLHLAQKVCDFIQRTSMTDMHHGNLLVRRDLQDWTFAIIDQEPVGLFIEENEDPGSLAKKEEWVLGGLMIFRDTYCRKNGLIEMAEYVEGRINTYLEQHQEIQVIDRGSWIEQGSPQFDWLTVIRILITIPFFYIILPVLALLAICPNRPRLAIPV